MLLLTCMLGQVLTAGPTCFAWYLAGHCCCWLGCTLQRSHRAVCRQAQVTQPFDGCIDVVPACFQDV